MNLIQEQTDIFALNEDNSGYLELCHALYERELAYLAKYGSNNVSLLKRRLEGLSHHIQQAAREFLQTDSPLQVDIHNASWQAKQAATCPGQKLSDEQITAWFIRNHKLGTPVPIYMNELGLQHIEIDSIDRIEVNMGQIHTNKFGWFNFNGQALAGSAKLPAHTSIRLLRPNKAVMTAACAGHQWRLRGKALTRSLSMRELRLSFQINWQHFGR